MYQTPDVGREMSLKEKIIRWEPEYEGRIERIKVPTCQTWGTKAVHHSHFKLELADNSSFNRLAEDAIACHRELWNVVNHPELIDPAEHKRALREYYQAYQHHTARGPKGLGRAEGIRQGFNNSCRRSRFAVGRAARLQNRVEEISMTKPGGLQDRKRTPGEL